MSIEVSIYSTALNLCLWTAITIFILTRWSRWSCVELRNVFESTVEPFLVRRFSGLIRAICYAHYTLFRYFDDVGESWLL